MSFAPDLTELLARARADLRMGVGVVLTGAGASVLVMAAETLAAARLGARLKTRYPPCARAIRYGFSFYPKAKTPIAWSARRAARPLKRC